MKRPISILMLDGHAPYAFVRYVGGIASFDQTPEFLDDAVLLDLQR